jgi:hypothetical protein
MSLDIKSIYTAIPVNDAIIAFREFCSKTNTTSFTWNKSVLTVETMVTLIKICLEDNHFTYNGTLYKQIHGLFMGGVFSPWMASIYMENSDNLVSNLPYVHFYTRYVDDTLLYIQEKYIPELLQYVKNLDKFIVFTHEIQNEYQMSFLDILILIKRSKFETSVFRKQIYAGITINYNSFQPFSYKLSFIYSTVYRAVKLCSNKALFDNEIKTIKQILQANDFPDHCIHQFVDKAIKKFSTPKVINISSPKTYLGIPFIPGCTDVNHNIYKENNISPYYHPIPNISKQLNVKQPVPSLNRSNVVYKISCTNCNNVYVGQTRRHLSERIGDHVRAVRDKNPKYATAMHTANTGHKLDLDNIKILGSNSNFNDLLYLEAAYIVSLETFNGTKEWRSINTMWVPTLCKVFNSKTTNS